MPTIPKTTRTKKPIAKKRSTPASPAGVTLTHGSVTVSIPAHLEPPAKAGKLSPDEVRRIPRTPHGIGLISDQVAGAITKAGSDFDPPRGVTSESLRAKGARAEDIDAVILDVEVILNQLKQANLLFDAEAWAELRKVNDQVKAQSKSNKQLLTIFKPLLDFLAKGPRTAPEAPAGDNK